MANKAISENHLAKVDYCLFMPMKFYYYKYGQTYFSMAEQDKKWPDL